MRKAVQLEVNKKILLESIFFRPASLIIKVSFIFKQLLMLLPSFLLFENLRLIILIRGMLFYPFLVPLLGDGHKTIQPFCQVGLSWPRERDIMASLKKSLVPEHDCLLMSVWGHGNVRDACLVKELNHFFFLITELFEKCCPPLSPIKFRHFWIWEHIYSGILPWMGIYKPYIRILFLNYLLDPPFSW